MGAVGGSMNRDARLAGLALVLWGFGEGLFLHIQLLYIKELGAAAVQIGALLSAANVVRALVYLPGGILADRLPRNWVMMGGWVTGLVGITLAGLARSWQALIPGLLVYATSAYCIPVINAYLAHAVGGRNLARTFTTVYADYTAGGIISPAVGGWLADIVTMHTVHFVSAALFASSTLTIVQVSPQAVPARTQHQPGWRALGNERFVRLAGVAVLLFTAMYLAFPFSPNFLKVVGGWRIGPIGLLGSFQALGAPVLSSLLGRFGREGDEGDSGAVRPKGWASRLLVGSGLVWGSVVGLLLARQLPLLAAAYLLRGAYQGCRSLTQARVTHLGQEADRGLLLGTTETLIAAAQVATPYAAGLLYAGNPIYPLISSLILIPLAVLFGVLALGL